MKAGVAWSALSDVGCRRDWLFLSGGGGLFVAAIHFGPWAVEPPADIIDLYNPGILGWIAFAWLIGFVAVLLVTSRYE